MTRAISLRRRVHRKMQARFWRPVERGDPSAEFNGQKPSDFQVSLGQRQAGRATHCPADGSFKSSVHRLKQAMERRDVHPASWLWKTAEGRRWLMRLVVATLYTFGLKRGVGVET